MELDLEETSGTPPWEDADESEPEDLDGRLDRTERAASSTHSRDSSYRRERLHETTLHGRPRESPPRLERSREPSSRHSDRVGETSRQDSSRLSRILSAHPPLLRPPVEQNPLPALPEPDPTQLPEDEDELDTLPSRRAAMFRSDPRPSQSPSLSFSRRSQELSVPPQEPIRVGLALTSTPSRSAISPADTTLGTTPHPPGRWQRSPIPPKGNVRFSPLPREAAGDDRSLNSSLGPGDGSVHRLRLSPAKKRSLGRDSPKGGRDRTDDSAEGDTSFIGRISSLSRAVTGR